MDFKKYLVNEVFKNKRFDIAEIIKTLRDAQDEMIRFNADNNQSNNIKLIKQAISSLGKIKNF